MALKWKTRRKLSLLVLLVWMPLYIFLVSLLAAIVPRPPEMGPIGVFIELFIYIVLGFIWILPLKPIFMGVGKPDPDAPKEDE
ncbi:MAG: hypothetical protein CR993_04380 [Rhodobacterales bacterium]|nr:MAG: hypothetical protein CR993_04380 [Rhodobacterales bacterium]